MKSFLLLFSFLMIAPMSSQDYEDKIYYSDLEYHFKENSTCLVSKLFKNKEISYDNGALYSLYETRDKRLISATRDVGTDEIYGEMFSTNMEFFGYKTVEVYDLIRVLYNLKTPRDLKEGCTNTIILSGENKGTYDCSEEKSYTDFTGGEFREDWNTQRLEVTDDNIRIDNVFLGPSVTILEISSDTHENMVKVKIHYFNT